MTEGRSAGNGRPASKHIVKTPFARQVPLVQCTSSCAKEMPIYGGASPVVGRVSDHTTAVPVHSFDSWPFVATSNTPRLAT